MLLVLTNSHDATADYLIPVLRESGLSVTRFDTDTLLSQARISYRNGHAHLYSGTRRFEPREITHLWYRRPTRLADNRLDDSPEARFTLAEWSEALEGFLAHIPFSRWMNHPAANARASHKLEQLSAARTLGFDIPDTLVTQEPSELRDFFQRHDQKIIAKPLSEGCVERQRTEIDSLIYTNEVLPEHLVYAADILSCPTLFQQLIPKYSDVRVTIVDREVHSVEMFAPNADRAQRCDIRRDNMSGVAYRETTLPDPIVDKVCALAKRYDLRFAAVDMVIDKKKKWYFLEVNPNGQWAWLDQAAGTNIARSFAVAFETARKRPV